MEGSREREGVRDGGSEGQSSIVFQAVPECFGSNREVKIHVTVNAKR